MPQAKSVYVQIYRNLPDQTGYLLIGEARPSFLGEMREKALAVAYSASGNNHYFDVYRQDRSGIDKDRYLASGVPDSEGYVSAWRYSHPNYDPEHHLSALPDRLTGMSSFTGWSSSS